MKTLAYRFLAAALALLIAGKAQAVLLKVDWELYTTWTHPDTDIEYETYRVYVYFTGEETIHVAAVINAWLTHLNADGTVGRGNVFFNQTDMFGEHQNRPPTQGQIDINPLWEFDTFATIGHWIADTDGIEGPPTPPILFSPQFGQRASDGFGGNQFLGNWDRGFGEAWFVNGNPLSYAAYTQANSGNEFKIALFQFSIQAGEYFEGEFGIGTAEYSTLYTGTPGIDPAIFHFTNVPPPTGACCVDFTCSITTEADCSGEYLGDDTTCDDDPCAAPTGACCVDFECSITTEAECSGEYLGDDTTCDDDPCAPPPTGACCLSFTCSITTEEECLGVYLGDDTTCADDPCAALPPPVLVIPFADGQVVAEPIEDFTDQPNGVEVQAAYEASGLYVYRISVEFDEPLSNLRAVFGTPGHPFIVGTAGSIHNTDHSAGDWYSPLPEENFDDPAHAFDSWVYLGMTPIPTLMGQFDVFHPNYLGFFGNVGPKGVFSTTFGGWVAEPEELGIGGGLIMQIGYDNGHSVDLQFNIGYYTFSPPKRVVMPVSLTLPAQE